MASYFSKYPKTIINNKLVTDIISRTFVRDKYASKLSIYYPYDLQEGDTPEIIASKYYGDPERHWIVMLANDIVDPFFDFSMDSQVFEKYINQKYKEHANSVNRWAYSNWRGEWTNTEYIVINGHTYNESEVNVTYSEDQTLEYIYDANTGITYTVTENGPDDIDIFTVYNTGDVVTIDGSAAFYCANTHPARNFLNELEIGNWVRILDGVNWKGDWQANTDYLRDDVVRYQSTIYICTQDNLDNANNNISFSNGQYWKTYTNGVEYATVTRNPDPFGYRATIVSTDLTSDISTTSTIYIDEKAFNGGENGYDDDIFNYTNFTINSEDISVTTTKEIISIYQYENEINERKRQIKLIKKEYVPQIERELKILMETYYG